MILLRDIKNSILKYIRKDEKKIICECKNEIILLSKIRISVPITAKLKPSFPSNRKGSFSPKTILY